MHLHEIKISIALCVLCFGCQKKPELPQATAAVVEVIEVTSSQISPQMELSGEIEASTRHELAFLVAGKLTSVGVEKGQQVRRGQNIAQLATTDYSEALQIAQSKLDEANDQYKRLAIARQQGSQHGLDNKSATALHRHTVKVLSIHTR